MYKALFNRPSITKSSADGRSCTLYPTKTVLLPEADDTMACSDVDIELFDAATIAAMTRSHIKRYHDFHFGLDRDPTNDNSRRYASTAKEFFEIALNTERSTEAASHLQSLLTAEMIDKDSLLCACVDAIEQQRIAQLSASQNRTLSYSKVEDKVVDQIQSVADSLAPFVNFFVIETGHTLL